MIWFQKAAEQRHPVAMLYLGVMYAEGRGVPQDYVRAYMWFNLGAASGNATAVKNRDTLTKLMAPSEINQAQKVARECEKRKFKDCD